MHGNRTQVDGSSKTWLMLHRKCSQRIIIIYLIRTHLGFFYRRPALVSTRWKNLRNLSQLQVHCLVFPGYITAEGVSFWWRRGSPGGLLWFSRLHRVPSQSQEAFQLEGPEGVLCPEGGDDRGSVRPVAHGMGGRIYDGQWDAGFCWRTSVEGGCQPGVV